MKRIILPDMMVVFDGKITSRDYDITEYDICHLMQVSAYPKLSMNERKRRFVAEIKIGDEILNTMYLAKIKINPCADGSLSVESVTLEKVKE